VAGDGYWTCGAGIDGAVSDWERLSDIKGRNRPGGVRLSAAIEHQRRESTEPCPIETSYRT